MRDRDAADVAPPAGGRAVGDRAGLNVGEAFVEESDYFGTSVVIARRLCDTGGAGQILASDIVVRLLEGAALISASRTSGRSS